MFEEFLKELIGIISKYPKEWVYVARKNSVYGEHIYYISPPTDELEISTELARTCFKLANLNKDYTSIKYYKDLVNSVCKENKEIKVFFELEEFRRRWLLPEEQHRLICGGLFVEELFNNRYDKNSIAFTIKDLEKLVSKRTYF